MWIMSDVTRMNTLGVSVFDMRRQQNNINKQTTNRLNLTFFKDRLLNHAQRMNTTK